MNLEHDDKFQTKAVTEIELEAATNSTFDAWTKNARNFYRDARKFTENLDDHTAMIMTDIFGPNVAKEHSRKLEAEAKREEEAGNTDAAKHYKRRDLNFSRSTVGEYNLYTVDLNNDLNHISDQQFKKFMADVEQNKVNQETSRLHTNKPHISY
jgi:hypothetical protein